MSNTALSRTRSQAEIQESSGTTVSAEIDKVVLVGIAAFTGVLGLWSLACVVSAMYQAGGPLQLVGEYFKALAGM